MNERIMIRIIVAAFVLVAVMIAGCAPSKVKMKRETVDSQEETAMVQRSLERFDAANFYVYEWRPGIPAAVVADLKDDDRTIRPGSGWRKIETREDLEQVYKSGSAYKAKANMRLYRIEGDDGEIWGYFFAYENRLPYTVVDDKTIELGGIPEPKAPGR
jgi:outer membrane murein-binding lipoprotein Lpp